MREVTVQVERQQRVRAAPEAVWALIREPMAWSLMPTRFGFAVPGELEGMRQPILVLGGHKTARCSVLDVCREIPDRQISWQVRSTHPSGREVITLSAEPRRGFAAMRVAYRNVVPRTAKIDYQNYWHKEIDTWIDRLRAVAEERAPWPDVGMSAEMQRAYAAAPRLADTEYAVAEVVIEVSADAVWNVLSAAESARMANPDQIAHSGHVPGTPIGQVGEMQYYIHRYPEGIFTGNVDVVRELSEGHQAVTQHVGPPYSEMHHVVTPVPGGARLRLAGYRPRAREAGPGGQDTAARASARLLRIAESYKTLIENLAGPVSGVASSDT